jgi:hypothetical protein
MDMDTASTSTPLLAGRNKQAGYRMTEKQSTHWE